MTKAEIADFVCGKMEKTDAESIARCQSFIERRYEMIWNNSLWQESLVAVTIPVEAESAEVTLDSSIEFPVAARIGGQELLPVDYQTVFQVDAEWFDRTGVTVGFVILPKDSEGNMRIRLLEAPGRDVSLNILGKKKLTPLANETDTPLLTGVENCLISFVEADMLEYCRQYGKAQSKLMEAGAHLQGMKNIEQQQSAKVSRIIPLTSGEWNTDSLAGWDVA